MESTSVSGLATGVESAIVFALGLVFLALSSMSFRSLSRLGLARARHLVEEGHKRLELFVEHAPEIWMTLHILDAASIVWVFWSGFLCFSALSIPLEAWAIWLLLGVVYFIFHTALGIWLSHGDERAMAERVVVGLKPFYILFRPLTFILCKFFRQIESSPEEKFGDAERLEEELEVMLDESQRQGGLEEAKGKIMRSAMDYSETAVREVMIPRTELTAFPVETTLDEALSVCVREGYSRLPVYEGNLDVIVGILYFKDLVKKYFELRDKDGVRAQTTVKTLVREAYFVPETNHIDAVFEDFKREHIHMAIVVDEFGGTSGLVTLEDIVEEFFGEIQDEYDSEDTSIVSLDNQEHVLVDARTNISEISELFDVDIEENPDYESVGGLVTNGLGHVGVVGEEVDMSGLHFVVREANERCILQVEISRQEPAEVSASE